MKKIYSLIFSLLLLVGFELNAGHLSSKLTFSAMLDGAQEVPAVTTNAKGLASLTLNGTRDTLCINVTAANLSGPITGAHLHNALPGVDGPAVINLTSYISGNHIAAYITGIDLAPSNLSRLIKGEFYINLHTAANPDGEIRGQVMLETNMAFHARLEGSQEVPAVTTNGYGLGIFDLERNDSLLALSVIFEDLSSAVTGAHLHVGAPGVAGAIVTDLTSYVVGNTIFAKIKALPILSDLKAGNIYINVHTTNNPTGEIRGQVRHLNVLYFDAYLDGLQEVPSVSTTAIGLASIRINPALDTVFYRALATGLSGAITGAHFHDAPVGVDGSVLIDLTPQISGNRLEGILTGSAITSDLIRKMIAGQIYLNLHTAANPGGEIRGQVYRYAREGYVFDLNGAEEVPAVTTNAFGSALVSMDRNETNLYFSMISTNLSSNFTGSHFHAGRVGETGGVIFDITPFLSNGGSGLTASGYWLSTDVTPLTPAVAKQFRTDSVYMNVHTTNNPTGEIRGQVARDLQCSSTLTAVKSVEQETVNLYPNPASESLVINFTQDCSSLRIYDLLGKPVYSTSLKAGSGNMTIDLSAFKKGIYFVNLSGGAKEITSKLIIN